MTPNFILTVILNFSDSLFFHLTETFWNKKYLIFWLKFCHTKILFQTCCFVLQRFSSQPYYDIVFNAVGLEISQEERERDYEDAEVKMF